MAIGEEKTISSTYNRPKKRPSIILNYDKTISKKISTDVPRWMTSN